MRLPMLETAPLTIAPLTPALAEAALTGRAHLGCALGVRVPDEGLEDDGEEILPVIAAMLRAAPQTEGMSAGASG